MNIASVQQTAVVVVVVIVAGVLAALSKLPVDVTASVLVGAIGYAGGHALGVSQGGSDDEPVKPEPVKPTPVPPPSA